MGVMSIEERIQVQEQEKLELEVGAACAPLRNMLSLVGTLETPLHYADTEKGTIGPQVRASIAVREIRDALVNAMLPVRVDEAIEKFMEQATKRGRRVAD